MFNQSNFDVTLDFTNVTSTQRTISITDTTRFMIAFIFLSKYIFERSYNPETIISKFLKFFQIMF